MDERVYNEIYVLNNSPSNLRFNGQDLTRSKHVSTNFNFVQTILSWRYILWEFFFGNNDKFCPFLKNLRMNLSKIHSFCNNVKMYKISKLFF